jgi:hypothetical protein
VTEQATIADNSTTAYAITSADANLLAIALADTNEFLPAAPFVCASEDRLALAGGIAHTTGVVDVTNGSTALTFTGASLTRAAEGKSFVRDGDTLGYTIESVDETGQTAVLTAAYQGVTGTDKTYRIIGDVNRVRFSNTLPGNIEGYDPTTAAGSVDVGGDNADPLTGIGLCRNHFVAAKRGSMHVLDYDATAGWTPVTVSRTVGCASHHTLAQDDAGNLLWYAGAAGVYRLVGGEFQVSTNKPQWLSQPITELLRSGVNHDRDHFAHACWYSPRQWYCLWTTRYGETGVTDQLTIGDFSEPTQGQPCRWWLFKLPALSSRVEQFSDGEPRLLISNYHGQILVFDSGTLDGIAEGTSQIARLTAVNASYLECDGAFFLDPTGNTKPNGAVVEVLTGTARGQRRFVSSVTQAGIRLNLDTVRYGGAFSPAPAVGDFVMLGNFDSYWRPPKLSGRVQGQKRWNELMLETTDLGAALRLDHYVTARGRELAGHRTMLPTDKRTENVVKLGGVGELYQAKIGSNEPDSPWEVRSLTVQAMAAGESR